MKPFDFWTNWLTILSGVIIAFGLGMALLNGTPLFDLFNTQVDPVFWNGQPLPATALAFRGWIYGVLGATMAGWGIFLLFLARNPFRRRESWAWKCVVVGILVWYVPDTAISFASGVYFNAYLNTALLILTALPLVFTFKEFHVPVEGDR